MIGYWNKRGFSQIAINSGRCFEFAWRLEEIFPEGEANWGEFCSNEFKTNIDPSGHCFFRYNGKYYDAESPKGEIFPDDLQYYQRSKKYFRKVA